MKTTLTHEPNPMWMVYFSTEVDPITGEPIEKWQAAATRDEALHAAKSLQTEPNFSLSRITGPDNEVLTAEQLAPLLKDL